MASGCGIWWWWWYNGVGEAVESGGVGVDATVEINCGGKGSGDDGDDTIEEMVVVMRVMTLR